MLCTKIPFRFLIMFREAWCQCGYSLEARFILNMAALPTNLSSHCVPKDSCYKCDVIYLNRSCPAVSQIWSLMRFPGSISTRREKKSTPTVGSDTWAKRPSVNRRIKHDFPTVESPMTINLNWYSHIASMSPSVWEIHTRCVDHNSVFRSKTRPGYKPSPHPHHPFLGEQCLRI